MYEIVTVTVSHSTVMNLSKLMWSVYHQLLHIILDVQYERIQSIERFASNFVAIITVISWVETVARSNPLLPFYKIGAMKKCIQGDGAFFYNKIN